MLKIYFDSTGSGLLFYCQQFSTIQLLSCWSFPGPGGGDPYDATFVKQEPGTLLQEGGDMELVQTAVTMLCLPLRGIQKHNTAVVEHWGAVARCTSDVQCSRDYKL